MAVAITGQRNNVLFSHNLCYVLKHRQQQIDLYIIQFEKHFKKYVICLLQLFYRHCVSAKTLIV